MKKVKGLKKYFGLMFKIRKTEPLIFEFNEPTNISIHSWFVFFPFMAYWYFDNKLIEKRFIRPFEKNIKPKYYFNKLVEIPIN